MRVAVYIDGFNLYYGVLRHSNYKWLDLQKFAESLLEPEQDEQLEILKYFTARVDGTANRRQEIYFRALRHSCPKIEIIEGYYLKTKTEMVPVDPRLGNKIEVWKHEEKGSDVRETNTIWH